ncbi:MAG: hypothetical protein DDG60_10745 [Anaerolineae bacterium]|nr:MAG: hypothetical protein DDG60_10745 [Anaerolineae bacterium]
MKKVLLVVAMLALAVVIFGAGFAFAQVQVVSAQSRPASLMGWGAGRGHGGYGWLHDYVEKALAEKLGLTEAQVEEQLAAGKTLYEIALAAGTPEADIPTLLEAVHKSALEKAVAAGVLTQAQAEAMLARMQARGWSADCPHDGTRPLDGTGYQHGHHGRWHLQPAQPNP